MSKFSYSIWIFFYFNIPKDQTKSKRFFQADISSKIQTNELYFTTLKPQVDLFSFVFWRKLKTPKRHFEINWPLVWRTLKKAITAISTIGLICSKSLTTCIAIKTWTMALELVRLTYVILKYDFPKYFGLIMKHVRVWIQTNILCRFCSTWGTINVEL